MARATAAQVYPDLRTPARALQAQGYTFDRQGGKALRLIAPDGKFTGLIFPGKGAGSQDVRHLMHELEKRGLYPPQAQGDTPGVAQVVRLPVEPRTSHQYRLDQVRAQVMRVLRELGGVGDREARRLFVQDAIETAQRHGLRLPATRVKGDAAAVREAVYTSARQSLQNLLSGDGQSGWMLDIWQLEVTMLAHPQPHVALNAPAVLAAANDRTVEVPAWAADGPEPLAAPAAPAVVVTQAVDDDNQLRQHVVRTRSGGASVPLPHVVPERPEQDATTKLQQAVQLLRDELAAGPRLGRDITKVAQAQGIGSRTVERARRELGVRTAQVTRGVYTWGLPGADGVTRSTPDPAPAPEVLLAAAQAADAAPAGDLAALRASYLQALQERALAGDALAAERLEILLGLR